MARLLLALLVAVLASSTSGAISLLENETCTLTDTGALDNSCLPTCVTCGCCHQAAEVTLPAEPQAIVLRVVMYHETLPGAPQQRSNEILHVPRA